MPLRLYICPLDEVRQVDAETGQPSAVPQYLARVGSKINPRTGIGYAFEAAASAHLRNWCVAMVRAIDFSGITADSQCIDLLEQEYTDQQALLEQTPAQLRWSNGKLNSFRSRLANQGVDVTGLLNTTPLYVWLNRLIAAAGSDCDCRRMRVHAREG